MMDDPIVVFLKTNCAPVVNEAFATAPNVKVVFLDEDVESCDADSLAIVEGEQLYVGMCVAEHDEPRAKAALSKLVEQGWPA
jgi:hypothetical protein